MSDRLEGLLAVAVLIGLSFAFQVIDERVHFGEERRAFDPAVTIGFVDCGVERSAEPLHLELVRFKRLLGEFFHAFRAARCDLGFCPNLKSARKRDRHHAPAFNLRRALPKWNRFCRTYREHAFLSSLLFRN